MEEQLISFKTAKLAKEKGFDTDIEGMSWIGTCYWKNGNLADDYFDENGKEFDTRFKYLAPTQALLQKFIREERGVHIELLRNASGYYWSMCREDGGTDLGWSDTSGPNNSGVWDTFEGALENALQVQLSYDLPLDLNTIKHWGNYVHYALKIN